MIHVAPRGVHETKSLSTEYRNSEKINHTSRSCLPATLSIYIKRIITMYIHTSIILCSGKTGSVSFIVFT